MNDRESIAESFARTTNRENEEMTLPAPRQLTANDYKTLWLATLGGCLEFYDFIIFVFFAKIIGDLFFPPEIPAWVRQFRGVRLNPLLVTPLYLLAGFSVGVVAVVPFIMIAAFPPAIRLSGVSFSYNLAYAIFGGVTPIIVIWLLRFDQLAPAYYTGVLSLLGFAIGIFLTDRLPNQVLGVSHSPALFNAPTFGVRKD